jgi:hypothetical protein
MEESHFVTGDLLLQRVCIISGNMIMWENLFTLSTGRR